jgi:peptidoglycan-associated lipoprotein
LVVFSFFKCTKKIDSVENILVVPKNIESPKPKIERTELPAKFVNDISKEEINENLVPVYFDFNKYVLRDLEITRLGDIASRLSKDKSLSIKIDGNTCEIGSAEYNMALSWERANAVAKYFIDSGITKNRIQTNAWGEERPTGKTLEFDRRTELNIYR